MIDLIPSLISRDHDPENPTGLENWRTQEEREAAIVFHRDRIDRDRDAGRMLDEPKEVLSQTDSCYPGWSETAEGGRLGTNYRGTGSRRYAR